MSDAPFRYWTWPELEAFMLEHHLAIQADPDNEGSLYATGRGEELFSFFIAMLRTGGSDPGIRLIAFAAEAAAHRLIEAADKLAEGTDE